jgi:histidine ammonia-lyase
VSLTAENRRLAAPASLDGGVTSALQEDFLCHATPAALKALKILDNLEIILAIELLAAGQAWDLTGGGPARAPRNEHLHRALRAAVDFYRDDRPLADDIERTRTWLRAVHPLDLAGS